MTAQVGTYPGFEARRYRNFIILGLLYAFFYMTRYNMAAAMPQIMAYFGWTKMQLGFFETALPIFYGLSVIMNGPLADRIGGKRAFLFGAVGVIVMNTLMGASTLLVDTPAVVEGSKHAMRVALPAVFNHGFTSDSLLVIMVVIWGLNGYFQSLGALSIVKVNAQWFGRLERGRFSAIFGILIRLGLIFAFSGVPLIAKSSLPLCWVWWIPAMCTTVVALLVLKYVENSPRDAGYPDFRTGDADDGDDRPAPLTEVLRKVFQNKTAWIIVGGSIMIGFVRRGTIDSWVPSYFNEVHGGADIAYQITAWGIALLGIAGGFALGLSSDKYFDGRRAPVICLGFIGMAFMLAFSGLVDIYKLGPFAAILPLALLSFFVNGAHGLIGGAASMDFGGKKASATAAGLFDGMQYLVAAPFTGTGMGWLLKNKGWEYWQWVPIPFAVLGAVLMLTIWNAKPKQSAAH